MLYVRGVYHVLHGITPVCIQWYTRFMHAPAITIEGVEYTFVKKRSQAPVAIYKGPDTFLRIGPDAYIAPEILYHQKLARFGFPLPEIVSVGTHDGQSYFTETSFGEQHLGEIFRANTINGIVADADFNLLIEIVKKFATAQLGTARTGTFDAEQFRTLIKLNDLLEELPELRESTVSAVEKVEKRIAALPVVLTHGDFNPYNIFSNGVIDWERGSDAPLGYDLTNCVIQVCFFPVDGDYEFTAGNRYTQAQIERYRMMVDSVCATAGVERISTYRNDFILCRSIWSVVRMHAWPKLQAWRNGQYKVLLKAYHENADLTEILRTFPY